LVNRVTQPIDMTLKTTKILLVEDNPGDARLIEYMLASAGDRIEIEWVSQALIPVCQGEVNG
jgi:hypothetical protein